MRLIDADAFDKVLEDAQIQCKRNGGNFRFGVLSTVRANLKNAPTVYRQSGYWTKVHGPDGAGNIVCECSNCHNCDEFALNVEVPFCWHCGTKMGGVVDTDNVIEHLDAQADRWRVN